MSSYPAYLSSYPTNLSVGLPIVSVCVSPIPSVCMSVFLSCLFGCLLLCVKYGLPILIIARQTERQTEKNSGGSWGQGRREDIRIDRQAGIQTDRNIWLPDIKVFGTLVRSSNHMSYPGGVNHEINT